MLSSKIPPALFNKWLEEFRKDKGKYGENIDVKFEFLHEKTVDYFRERKNYNYQLGGIKKMTLAEKNIIAEICTITRFPFNTVSKTLKEVLPLAKEFVKGEKAYMVLKDWNGMEYALVAGLELEEGDTDKIMTSVDSNKRSVLKTGVTLRTGAEDDSNLPVPTFWRRILTSAEDSELIVPIKKDATSRILDETTSDEPTTIGVMGFTRTGKDQFTTPHVEWLEWIADELTRVILDAKTGERTSAFFRTQPTHRGTTKLA